MHRLVGLGGLAVPGPVLSRQDVKIPRHDKEYVIIILRCWREKIQHFMSPEEFSPHTEPTRLIPPTDVSGKKRWLPSMYVWRCVCNWKVTLHLSHPSTMKSSGRDRYTWGRTFADQSLSLSLTRSHTLTGSRTLFLFFSFTHKRTLFFICHTHTHTYTWILSLLQFFA